MLSFPYSFVHLFSWKAAKRAVVVVTGKGELRQQFEAAELFGSIVLSPLAWQERYAGMVLDSQAHSTCKAMILCLWNLRGELGAVRVLTLWLETWIWSDAGKASSAEMLRLSFADYALLLGSADLGLSAGLKA